MGSRVKLCTQEEDKELLVSKQQPIIVQLNQPIRLVVYLCGDGGTVHAGYGFQDFLYQRFGSIARLSERRRKIGPRGDGSWSDQRWNQEAVKQHDDWKKQEVIKHNILRLWNETKQYRKLNRSIYF